MRPTVPAKPWSGTRPATQFGSICPQQDELLGQQSSTEDCLTLNVYAPAARGALARPVLVWVHGGGLRTGSSSYFDASVLARKLDAVVVTVNYRLGIFGFLATSGMATEGKALNFGLQDQFEALRWVKKNAAAFGGDAARITFAGQSGGASAAGCLALISPKSGGLFHRAIAMSSYCASVLDPVKKAADLGDAVGASHGCPAGPDQMRCLRALTAADLLRSTEPGAPSTNSVANGDWHAVIDGEVLTSPVLSALSKGKFHRVPVMLGTTRDEGRFFIGLLHAVLQRSATEAEYNDTLKAMAGSAASFVLAAYPLSKYESPDVALSAIVTDNSFACPTHTVGRYLSSHVPTYRYEFADSQAPVPYQDPFMSWGAYHAAELSYVFRTAASDEKFTATQIALSETMLAYLKRFVAAGDPNAQLNDANTPPVWPRFNRLLAPVQTFGPDAITTQSWSAFSSAHKCWLWSTLFELQAATGSL